MLATFLDFEEEKIHILMFYCVRSYRGPMSMTLMYQKIKSKQFLKGPKTSTFEHAAGSGSGASAVQRQTFMETLNKIL